MKLSIIIPAFNEEQRIVATLVKISSYLKKKRIVAEIIVVDDCSSDDTVRKVKKSNICAKILHHSVNLGKGAAVRTGMLKASGDFLLFSDADLSAPIEGLDNFLPWLNNGFDVVIGSRAVSGALLGVRQPFYREIIGKIFNKLVRVLTVRGIKDTQCGFKLFSRKCARDVFRRQIMTGFSFDVEVLFLADKLGYKIKELPVVWNNAKGSKVAPLKDSLRMFRDLFRIRFNYFFS